jgi:hypothetical protein
METRSIAIGLVAIVAAFAAAFGVAKSGGSKTETAGAGVKAQTIKVASPGAVAGVEVGGTLPALKAERKPAKKKKKASSESNTTSTATAAPSATAEPSTPSTNNTTPPATNTNPTPPANNNPPPAKKEQPIQSEEPASGGGEDG